MFSKTPRPSSIAVDDAREVVIQEHDVGGFPGDIRPRDAHRDTDVGRPQCRRIVDAVACDGDDVPLALEGCYDTQLLLGGHARAHDLGCVECELDFNVRHARQVVARQHGRRGRRDEADLPGDRERGTRVIAGDHHDLESGVPAATNGCRHFRTRRVLEARRVRSGRDPAPRPPGYSGGQYPMSEREHAESAIGHFRRHSTDGRACSAVSGAARRHARSSRLSARPLPALL